MANCAKTSLRRLSRDDAMRTRSRRYGKPVKPNTKRHYVCWDGQQFGVVSGLQLRVDAGRWCPRVACYDERAARVELERVSKVRKG